MYADASVGSLLEQLKLRGLYDDSLILLTADHGDAFFKHKLFDHNYTLYDDMMRVPLIVKFPKSAGIAPRRIYEPTEAVDIVPTLFDYLRLPAPERLEGESLWPLISGQAQQLERPEVVTATAWLDLHAIRVGNFKYIVDLEGHEELYDLKSDPDEQQNLIGRHADKARALRDKLGSLVDLESVVAILRGYRPQEDPQVQELLETLGYVDDSD